VDAAWEIHAIASLPRALGALGVGILNAADDLAGGGAALTRGAGQAGIPRRLARVIPGTLEDKQVGKIVSLGRPGSPDVFVTAAADIRRIRTARGLAKKLTLVDETGQLRQGPFIVIEFDTPWGIATPVFRNDPGFVGGGRTAGGAREFVVPNLPLNQLSNPRYYMIR